MRVRYTLVLIFCCASLSANAQVLHEVTVHPEAQGEWETGTYKPGLFYFQFYRNGTNAIFDYLSHEKMYNSLRETKFYSECWRHSTGFQDVFDRMRQYNLRGWLEHLDDYTDRLVVKINGMPYWLSSDKSTRTLNDQSWREFMTHPPADYAVWDSLITAVADTIASWGIHPYYEIWNEPDGEYWQGTNDELLELYKHTALAIRRADTLAKVGGVGMHTWWRSVDPADAAIQQPYMGALFGPIPKEISYGFSFLFSLLDSVQHAWDADNVPLDFISYHHFNHNLQEVGYNAGALRLKMHELGYCRRGDPCPDGRRVAPELYLSEWQTTYGAQEQHFQPPLFINLIRAMGEAEITFHSIAAIGDFAETPDDEFVHEWGMLSQNNLVKPVYKALQLLSAVTSHGTPVQTESSDGLTVFASSSSDTLRMLLANYSMPISWFAGYPKLGWSGYEQALWTPGSFRNRIDYTRAGHNALYWGDAPQGEYGTLDKVFHGELAPFPISDPLIMNALQAARERYVSDSIANTSSHQIRIAIPGNNKTLAGRVLRIDSTHHNVIAVYDSLRTKAGFSHERAVDSLQSCSFPGGCYGVGWYSEEITMDGEVLVLEAQVNSVIYLEFTDVTPSSVADVPRAEDIALRIYPNPAHSYINVSYNAVSDVDHVSLTDMLGRIVYSEQLHGEGLHVIYRDNLPPGMYVVRLLGQSRPVSSQVVWFH